MPIVYSAARKTPLLCPVAHDPDSEVYYTYQYRPPLWVASTEKRQADSVNKLGDLVRPATANGHYAECISSGVTAAGEPTWVATDGASISDGSVDWLMHHDDFEVRDGDSIFSSTWLSDTGVVLSDDGVDGFDVFTKVTAVPVGAKYFVLVNELVVDRSNGHRETLNRSIKVRIRET